MNRTRMLLIAFLALALSVMVAFLAYRALKSRLSPPREETAQVVVAAEKLSLGMRLAQPHLRTVSWPKATLPEGCFSDPQEIEGRGVIVPITPNEPVLESKLAPKEAGAGLTSAIPEGMRAVAVKVNDVIGVAGFVLPGTRVDVIAVGQTQSGSELSKVFLENIQVLAAGQNVEQDANGKPQSVQVVTMLVSPEDAQKLALASTNSRIQLALRNPLDLEKKDPAAVQKAALYSGSSAGTELARSQVAKRRPAVVRYGPKRVARKPEISQAPAVVEPPERRLFVVELIRGDKRETSTFEMKKP